MAVINSFSPILSLAPTKLILGSMPGKRSLQEVQYYAHPQNVFWRIIENLYNSDRVQYKNTDYAKADHRKKLYEEKIQLIKKSDLALWDVLQGCSREGSLDSDIIESSIVINDFSAFLAKHKTIKHIYFNGAKAEQLYKRYVVPTLGEPEKHLPTTRLPSTSPAYAALSFENKLQAWQLMMQP